MVQYGSYIENSNRRKYIVKIVFQRVISSFVIVAVLVFSGLSSSTSHAAEKEIEKLNPDFNQAPVFNSQVEEVTEPQYSARIILPPGIKYWAQKAADAADASAKIPKKLKKSDDVVDLDKCKDKYGSTPKTKSSGVFKNGEWTIDKDTAGHIGYDGSLKKWKIKKNGKRIGSLNKNGKVIDKQGDSMIFNGWKLEIEDNIDVVVDHNNKKMVLLNNDNDEIHSILTVSENGKLIVNPRWNVVFVLSEKKIIKISTNS